jgi:formylglycine-generating enzyme required for sulfatase activity
MTNRKGSRRRFLLTSTKLGIWVLLAQGTRVRAGTEKVNTLLGPLNSRGIPGDVISAPADPAQWPAWREELRAWRTKARQATRYDGSLYGRSDFAWVTSDFSCCFVMMCDETFHEPKQGRFAVESFLAQGEREFGGYDSLVLWHAYPRIGFDERNQFDFYRDMPGGLAGLREVSRACHARGVRVFIDYNPWDTGTRREGKPDVDALTELVAALEADGIFLDTMSQGAAEFRAKLDTARRGVVLEGEGALPLENLHDHHMSWAQWFNDSAVPGVLRNKWFERRHMQHQIKRWERDHSGELHAAWMNGSGMMVWENVFGSWVGWNERDRSILRAMQPIQRRYAALFSGEGWTPLVPTEQKDLYASLWEGPGLRLWTLVNRADHPVEGVLLRVAHDPSQECFDLITGRSHVAAVREESLLMTGQVLPRGIGCFVAGTRAALDNGFSDFLARQAQLQASASFSTKFPDRRVELRPVQATRKPVAVPDGMVEIPAARFAMQVEFQVRECGFYDSVPSQGLDWGNLHRPKLLTRNVSVGPYAMDLTPVTNGQFAGFLKAGGYKPKHPDNFLKHWQDGAPPPGREDHPVVYVSLEDARAYAAWAGKRLPTEEEWQFAAGGPEQRLFPWGPTLRAGVCNDGRSGGTTPVRAYPEGRSSFGCYDLCGNVWHWTESERSDGRTRFCILKGGSWFKARGSGWYADGGPQACRFAAKFLLMCPGLDRCSTIGFRCVMDQPAA